MTTTEYGIVSDIARGADWLDDGNGNWTQLRRSASAQWANKVSTTTGLTYGYWGGTAWNGSAWTSVADGTTALTDNATNYVERTVAGVVSKNTSGFTASSLPMAVVVTLSGAITTITDRRMPTVPTSTGGDALTSGTLAQFAATTSAELRGVLSDETGTGAAVFATAPTLSNPVVGTQSAGDNSTKAASTAYVDTADALKANLASPTFTGTPAAPTAGAGTNTTQVATTAFVKTAVDAAVAGLSWKQAVRVATTVAGTLASSFENGDTVDGVTLATGDRILIKNQAAPAENGIYVVPASGAPTRSTDADAGSELVNAAVFVSEGTTNADTQWTCTNNATPTLGSTSITFAQAGGGTTYTADESTLHLSGTTFSAKAGGITGTEIATDVALGGNPTTTTQTAGNNTTRIATTAFVSTAVAGVSGAGISLSTIDAKGDLLAGTANDTVARVPVGTNNYVLMADSAATPGIKWAKARGRILLATVTANNSSANMDVLTRNDADAPSTGSALFLSDFDVYEAEIINVLTASSTDFRMRVAVSGSVQSGASDYGYHRAIAIYGASTASDSSAATTSIGLSVTSTLATTSVTGFVGSLKIYDPLNAAAYKRINGMVNGRDGTTERGASVWGTYNSASAIDGLRFLASAGNVVSGTIRVYGVP